MRIASVGIVAPLLAIALLAGGCKKGFAILVDDDGGPPRFRLESYGIFGILPRQGIEITNLTVLDFFPDGKVKDVMWRIESTDGSPQDVRDITYGVVPAGFRETSPPKPLMSRERYIIWGGMSGKDGHAEFILK